MLKRRRFMNKPKIFRKRFIPNEIVDISSDEFIYRDNEVIITRWKPIKPRTDFAWGISYTFHKEGYKISRFYNCNDDLLYWYCDIIEVEYYLEEDKFILNDLLVDVKILPDGKINILDFDELSLALENDLITKTQLATAIQNFSKLVELINSNNFPPEICKREKFE